jgi:hypothetical protein
MDWREQPQEGTQNAPTSPANPDGRTRRLVGVMRRGRLRLHMRRLAFVSALVVLVGAGVSVWFSAVGTKDCWRVDAGERCIETSWYALTLQKESEVETLNGQPDGLRMEWYRNGNVWLQGQYDRDGRTGRWYEYFYDGSPRFSGTYDKDVLHGTETWWYTAGRIEWQVYRHRGDKHGQEIWWHDSGARKRVGKFVHGKRDGTFLHYQPDGSLAFRSTYRDGERVLDPTG